MKLDPTDQEGHIVIQTWTNPDPRPHPALGGASNAMQEEYQAWLAEEERRRQMQALVDASVRAWTNGPSRDVDLTQFSGPRG